MSWRRIAKRTVVVLYCTTLGLAMLWEILVRAGSIPDELLAVSRVESLTVVDADGRVLRQTAGGLGGRERWVPSSGISPELVQATLAAEDHRFYDHNGVDWLALARAGWLNVKGQGTFGGSTLTMQLARNLGGLSRNVTGKFRQAVWAARLERQLTKEQILEHYLNRIYYGNGAWGAEAAAQLYFGKTAGELSLGESAFLAVLPRGPEYYDPFRFYSRVLRRRLHILELMVERGMIRRADLALAVRTPLALRRHPGRFLAPHFVDHVIGELPPNHPRTGTIETTLDGALQTRIEEATRRHLDQVSGLQITQAAVVVMRNQDGAILSMVGSGDYFDHEKNGGWNYATARLRPGSTLKPFVYGLALEAGDTPATLAYDLVLPEDVTEFYTKDVRQHGVARYREALAGSYNLAAVHALQKVGLDKALERFRRAGLGTLDQPDASYDWGLAIGHAEVRLIDLVGAFSVFARAGRPIVPRALRTDAIRERPAVFSPEVAYLIYDILQDPDARRPMFGQNVPLALPFRIALKTGTTRAYTDNWAIGVTREYTIGVWAGNFDGSPTAQVMSMRGATPLLRAAYVAVAARYGEPTAPPEPAGLSRAPVCALSGQKPGPHCPHRKLETFLAGTEPEHECTWHQELCGRTEVVYPVVARPWAFFRGLMRSSQCDQARAHSDALEITFPRSGSIFHLDPFRPARDQVPPLRALPAGTDVRWTISGQPAETWTPTPGEHIVRAERGRLSDAVTIRIQP